MLDELSPARTSAPGSHRRLGGRFPWWGWLPYLVLGLAVTFWAITHFGAVVSGAGSPQAIGFGIGALVLAGLLLIGVARLTRRGWAGQLAGLVPLIAASVIAVLPSYVSTAVDEAAPDGLPPVAGSSAPVEPSADPTGPEASESAPAPEPEPSAPPPGPVELGNAGFVGIDHDAAGIARLIQLADGSFLVRFEQFSVEPGPDYDVYLLPVAGATEPTDQAIALGDLRGTEGDQNYEVSADAALGAGPLTVLIWCEVFAVPVANASFG